MVYHSRALRPTSLVSATCSSHYPTLDDVILIIMLTTLMAHSHVCPSASRSHSKGNYSLLCHYIPYCNILNVSPPRPEIVGPDKSLSPTRKPFNNILQYGVLSLSSHGLLSDFSAIPIQLSPVTSRPSLSGSTVTKPY